MVVKMVDKSNFSKHKKDGRTKGHELTLVKEQRRFDIRKYPFSQVTINEWDKLCTGCINSVYVKNKNG